MVWASYKEGDVTWFATKAYFALWEQRERRCLLKPDEPRRYSAEEIQSILNESSRYKVAAAVRQLETCGLVAVSETNIRFCEDVHQLESAQAKARAQRMLNNVHPNTRSKIIAVPRRLLKLIIRSGRKMVRAATLIGLILTTMLVKKYGAFQGCCKAEWIANLFGVDAKRVMHERSKLIAEGWFTIIRTSQKVLNRFGVWVSLNLKPSTLLDKHPVPVENPPADNSEWQPAPDPNSQQLQPPPKKPDTPSEISKNQPPSLHIPSGAYQPQHPENPTWTNIQPNDLRLDSRSDALRQQAIQRGYLNPTPADRINFYAAITHALRVAKHNACGLLRTIVEKGLWQVISQADEYNAIARLRRATTCAETQHIQPEGNNPLVTSIATRTETINDEWAPLSQDALIVQTLTADLRQAGVSGDLFALVQRHGYLQDWDRERWGRAEQDVAQARLFRARERPCDPGRPGASFCHQRVYPHGGAAQSPVSPAAPGSAAL
jgi:hypothetical protein